MSKDATKDTKKKGEAVPIKRVETANTETAAVPVEDVLSPTTTSTYDMAGDQSKVQSQAQRDKAWRDSIEEGRKHPRLLLDVFGFNRK